MWTYLIYTNLFILKTKFHTNSSQYYFFVVISFFCLDNYLNQQNLVVSNAFLNRKKPALGDINANTILGSTQSINWKTNPFSVYRSKFWHCTSVWDNPVPPEACAGCALFSSLWQSCPHQWEELKTLHQRLHCVKALPLKPWVQLHPAPPAGDNLSLCLTFFSFWLMMCKQQHLHLLFLLYFICSGIMAVRFIQSG